MIFLESQKGDKIEILPYFHRQSEKENVKRQKANAVRDKYPNKAVYHQNDEHVADVRTDETVVNEKRDKHLDCRESKKGNEIKQPFFHIAAYPCQSSIAAFFERMG